MRGMEGKIGVYLVWCAEPRCVNAPRRPTSAIWHLWVVVQTERGQASFFFFWCCCLRWRGKTGRGELGAGLSGVG